MYDISCYSDICLSIGKTKIGQIEFFKSDDIIKCVCSISSNLTNDIPNINIDTLTPIPEITPIHNNTIKPEIPGGSEISIYNRKKNILLNSISLFIVILLLL